MVCFHPIKVSQKAYRTYTDNELLTKKENKVHFRPYNNEYQFELPCGHCLGCRLDHANMWATRISCEAECWKHNCFVTLTYRPKDLPVITCGSHKGQSTLVQRDVQLFLKRLRKAEKGFEPYEEEYFNNNLEPCKKVTYPIRYFYCGEYGTNPNATHRAHYHMAIFNWQPNDLQFLRHVKTGNLEYDLFKSKKLQKLWGKGFCVIGILNYNTASYIARYVQKKAGLQPQKINWEYEINGDKHKIITVADLLKPTPEFIRMSNRPGIGAIYWKRYKDKVKRNDGILIKIQDKVKTKPIPRYFKKLWERENWQEFWNWKYQQHIKFEKHKIEILKQRTLKDYEDQNYKWQLHLEIQENILKKKADYLRRDNFQQLLI